ncbi:aminopeptidase P family protein [Plastorhodobacter daqingensis]|uniref:Aminopeptidase P family protein n=1 Tax=Plastorhodobacter daqingensis TaxID=1387281 RepID=A0ABW2UH93_9RHOB
MFQGFTAATRPEQGPPRLALLRAEMRAEGLEGFLVPRADAHQGEYVAPHDDRLAWLTGFTGSAGFCIALQDQAGVFIDGRYRLQVRAQVDLATFSPVNWPETKPAAWLRANLAPGVVGFDPWLHTAEEIETLEKELAGSGITLRRVENLIDRIWADQPPPPCGKVIVHPEALAGESSTDKRTRLAAVLRAAGQAAAVITLPDSLCWLLNIRGSDIPRNPVVHGFAILRDDARLALFIDAAKLDPTVIAHLGDVEILPPESLGHALQALPGPVRVDRATAPLWVSDRLSARPDWGQDPCILPKARKNAAELEGARAAHLRDGAAMAEFLAWLDARPEGLTEIDVVRKLEAFRSRSNLLRDISFETIAGAGPDGAIVHYRVTEGTNRPLREGELLLVDSGGQYADGTTDITRTIALGEVGTAEKEAFTRVLQGMIAMSRARFPKGLAGRDLDALARYPLWLAGQDYDHGTGHGVGAFLSVHEGPQRLSRVSDVPLEPGMILSNEPGYYREGAFGIRIENLIVVQPAPALPGADAREMLNFETLTLCPIDRRVILPDMLSQAERDWLNSYHTRVAAALAPLVSPETRDWLVRATQPI